MNGSVKESDWKLFRKKLPEWQEAYMGKLNQEYLAFIKKVSFDEKIIIEVPATDLDFLKSLDVQDEFELVRFLDDGQSFETTDAERLLRYIDEQRMKEKASEEPDEERIRSFRNLYTAVRYYVTEQKRLRRKKKLLSTTGITFSYLKNNWEECDFHYNVSIDPDDWHYEVYRRYGDLPDGRHFGVYIWPKSEAWPPESAMMIVSKTGKMQINTIMDDRWEAKDAFEGCACEEKYLRLRNAD